MHLVYFIDSSKYEPNTAPLMYSSVRGGMAITKKSNICVVLVSVCCNDGDGANPSR
jgi:hypothetical protein